MSNYPSNLTRVAWFDLCGHSTFFCRKLQAICTLTDKVFHRFIETVTIHSFTLRIHLEVAYHFTMGNQRRVWFYLKGSELLKELVNGFQ